MPTIYKTSDGMTHSVESHARQYQDYLDGKSPYPTIGQLNSANANARKVNIINAYNNGDWDTVLRNVTGANKEEYPNEIVNLIASIAYAQKGDCEKSLIALLHYDAVYDYWFPKYTVAAREERLKLRRYAKETAKQALSKSKGRVVTDDEFKQFHISLCENQMVNDNQYFRDEWERTWRSLTGKDKFSPSSSNADQRNGFVSFLFGLVCGIGAYFASDWVLSLFLEEYKAGLIFGVIAIIIFFIASSAWKNKRNVVFIITLVFGVVGYLNLLGIMPNSTATTSATQSAAASATITSGCNFRSGPSTNDAVIRGLSQGDTVTLTGETQGGWTKVSHNGDIGWVSSEFLGK